MTPRIRVTAGVVLLTANAAIAAAQAPPPPAPVPVAVARDNTTGPQTGTGRIRGRVVDAESGSPLMDVLMRLSGGGLRESPAVGTDEDGRFEFENLPAGRFNLVANKPGYMTLSFGQRRPFENGRPIELTNGQMLENIDFAVPRGGVIVARVTDENGDPFAGVPIQAQRFRFAGAQRTLAPVSSSFDTTDDRGEVRVFGLPPGEYYVSTLTLGGGFAAASNGTSYVATFYPGTAAVENAERVVVQAAKEVHVNIPLVAAKLARVSGVVRRADGSPGTRASVLLAPNSNTLGFFSSAPVQPDATFSIANVPPGEYLIQAQFASSPQEDREIARVPVSVAGRDVTGIAVAMTTGGTIHGRFVFDTQAPANFSFKTLRPFVVAPPTSSGIVFAPPGTPSMQDDGTFTIRGVMEPGYVRLQAIPAGWFFKGVTLDGRDVTDVLIGPENRRELTGLEIVLTQKRAGIGGGARDDKGAPVGDYTAVVFADDRALWTPESRFIATARPDQQGRFRILGLPPGKYLAAAIDYIETGSERDPDLLGRLRERATPVTLTEGELIGVTLSLQ